MWSSLALAAALCSAPAQTPAAGQPPTGGLKLDNVRMTVGELGPPRPSPRLLPGDILFVAFDIVGLSIEPDGMAEYTMAMEVTDGAGKLIFKQDPAKLVNFIPLRGNRMPARAFITIGLDQPPGAYSGKVTVTDPKTKAPNSLSVKFEVLKRDFGIVAVYTSYEEGGRMPAPTNGQVGETRFIQFSVASFQRDPKTKQPRVEFEFNVLEKGQPTLAKPSRHVQDEKSPNQVDEKEGAFTMRFPLYMSRPGNFTFQVTATDKVANKTAKYELPITVLPQQ
jgi:hypothetical protein